MARFPTFAAIQPWNCGSICSWHKIFIIFVLVVIVIALVVLTFMRKHDTQWSLYFLISLGYLLFPFFPFCNEFCPNILYVEATDYGHSPLPKYPPPYSFSNFRCISVGMISLRNSLHEKSQYQAQFPVQLQLGLAYPPSPHYRKYFYLQLESLFFILFEPPHICIIAFRLSLCHTNKIHDVFLYIVAFFSFVSNLDLIIPIYICV